MALNANIEGVATVVSPPETLALTSIRCGRLWRMPLYASSNKRRTKKSRGMKPSLRLLARDCCHGAWETVVL
jgi:hypothetical protein